MKNNKRAFSVGHRKPVVIDFSDPRNNSSNKYRSKLGRELIIKGVTGDNKLQNSIPWTPENPSFGSLTPDIQNITGGTGVYLITSDFIPSSEFIGDISYSISGETNLPSGLSINVLTGEVFGTPTTSLISGSFIITAVDAFGTSGTSILNLTVLASAEISPALQSVHCEIDSLLTPTTAFIPNERFVGTVTYSISGGILPSGLSFDTDTGIISGTPTTILEETNFTITASGIDIFGTNITAYATIKLAVLVKPNIIPTTQNIQGETNTPLMPTSEYTPNERFVGIVSYAISAGTLPTGLLFNTSTGIISGTPTTALEETEFIITANGFDIFAESVNATATIILTVLPAPEITPQYQTLVGLVNIAITPTTGFTPNARFTAPVTYTLIPPVGRSLPSGLSFDTSTGIISGTPTTTLGTTEFTIQASDTFGVTDTAIISLNVTATSLVVGPETINSPSLTDAASITNIAVLSTAASDTVYVASITDSVSTLELSSLTASVADTISSLTITDSVLADLIGNLSSGVSENITLNTITDNQPILQLL